MLPEKPGDRLFKALLESGKTRPTRLSDLLAPPIPPPPSLRSIADFLTALATKRKVFISYHHGNDQWAYDLFSQWYGEKYELFSDQSLNGKIRSDDAEYVNRAIREDHIVGSSITIVLCGSETWKRKYVDWEIHSTLYNKHALLGLDLASAIKNAARNTIIPDRLYDNLRTGYAHCVPLATIRDAEHLKLVIEEAITKSKNTGAIDNSRQKMSRNLS
jgi:hypothetical protein